MEFIAFSDIHFDKNHNKSSVSLGGLTTWMECQEDIIDQIIGYAQVNKIQNVFFGGDLFEKKNYLPQDLYNFVWDIFSEHAIYSNLIFNLNTGNHDYHSKVSSSLKPFSSIVNVVSEVQDIPLMNGIIRMIPHGKIIGNLKLPKGYEEYVVFTHEDIAELKYGPQDYTSSSRYKVQIFGDWDVVFNGHIHTAQKLGNIINMGSCMRQNFGETDEKYFYHYKDGKTKKIQIECPKFIIAPGFSDKIRATVETNDYDFFRIDITPEELGDPVFKKYNVFPNVVKFKDKKKRLEINMSEEDELLKYVELMESDLNTKKLLTFVEKLK